MSDSPDPRSGASADPLVGRTLSQRYRILAKLGEGAMASVYLAEHTGVGTNIVLKVLLPELAKNRELVDRFLQEAKIASDVHHDNVIDIFYSGRSPEGLVFLAMEYLPGASLQQVLASDGALPWTRAQPILHQVADALAAAHAQGVIHRDVKPENVLIVQRQQAEGPFEFVKVVDFGISNVAGGQAESKGVFGTPQYMAPEQAQAQPPDPRDDVYAFGCLMYHVVTGAPPFSGPSVKELLLQQIRASPEPPRLRRPELQISEAVEQVILRAMQKRRADRWPSMAALAEALAALPAREPEPPSPEVSPAPSPPPSRDAPPDVVEGAAAPSAPSRGPLLFRVALAVTVVGLIAAAALLYHGPRAAPGRLEIVTQPADATIYLGDRRVGEHSPLLIEASPGPYTLRVLRDGYDPHYQTLQLRSRDVLRLSVTLRVSEATRLELLSEPPGARIRLDGVPLGGPPATARTPHTVTRVAPGPHVVQMDDVDGRAPWREEIDVVLGAHRRIVAVLPVLPPPPPSKLAAPVVRKGTRSTEDAAKTGGKLQAPPAAAPARRQGSGIMYLDIDKPAADKPSDPPR